MHDHPQLRQAALAGATRSVAKPRCQLPREEQQTADRTQRCMGDTVTVRHHGLHQTRGSTMTLTASTHADKQVCN